MNKREFLAAGIAAAGLAGANSAFAQQGSAGLASGGTRAKPKPPSCSNARPVIPTRLPSRRRACGSANRKSPARPPSIITMPEPKDLTEHAWLVDWNGKVLKTVATQSRNTSGMAVGGGYVWMCANAAPEGVFQVDMNSKQVSHRQIPLGPAGQRRRMPRRIVA